MSNEHTMSLNQLNTELKNENFRIPLQCCTALGYQCCVLKHCTMWGWSGSLSSRMATGPDFVVAANVALCLDVLVIRLRYLT